MHWQEAELEDVQAACGQVARSMKHVIVEAQPIAFVLRAADSFARFCYRRVQRRSARDGPERRFDVVNHQIGMVREVALQCRVRSAGWYLRARRWCWAVAVPAGAGTTVDVDTATAGSRLGACSGTVALAAQSQERRGRIVPPNRRQ